jgi:hypothetical protein
MPERSSSTASERPITHTVVVSLNDLEALTIVRAVEHLRDHPVRGAIRPDVHMRRHPWGGRADLTDKDVETLAPTVVLVEMPDESLRRRIERTNRAVIVVDHHIYAGRDGDLQDLRNARSSLEQVLVLLGASLSDLPLPLARDIPLIAANDRGFIPELATAAGHRLQHEARQNADPGQDKDDAGAAERLKKAVRDETWRIRTDELTLSRLANAQDSGDTLAELLAYDSTSAASRKDREVTQAGLKAAQDELEAAFASGRARWLDLNGIPFKGCGPRLLLACVSDAFRYDMADAVYRRAEEADGHDLTTPIEMLLVFTDQRETNTPDVAARTITRVEFSGGPDRRQQVAEWFDPSVRAGWPKAFERLKIYAGGGDSAYFGAEDPVGGYGSALSELVDWLLDDLLTGNRPVAAWRTNFVQALFIGDPLDKEVERTEGADERDGATTPEPSTLKARILSHLQQQRTGKGPEDLPKVVRVEDEEWHYFLPHLRDLVVWRPSDKATAWDEAMAAVRQDHSIMSFELPLSDLSLGLKRKDFAGPITLPIQDLRLHFHANDVLLVEWTVGEEPPEAQSKTDINSNRPKKTADRSRPKTRWIALVDPPADALARPLGHVVEINGKLRFTHSAMREGGEQKGAATITLMESGRSLGVLEHAKRISESPFEGYFLELLKLVLGLNDDDFDAFASRRRDLSRPTVRALFDDRARVITSVVPTGNAPATPTGKANWEVMLARLATVEPYGTGHAYDSAFALAEYRKGLYRRYQEWGTLYAATSHSFMAVAMDSEFSRKDLFGNHMRTMYRRMALLAQGYVAVLGAFALEVDDALVLSRTGKTAKDREEALTRYYHYLHRGQLHFTNHVWFERISSQIQAIELFELMSRQSGCHGEYRMVRDEIEQMQGFLAAEDGARAEANKAEEERRERALAAIALPFALLFALLGSQGLSDHFFLWPLMVTVVERLGFNAEWTWVLVSLGALVGTLVVGLAIAPRMFEGWPLLGRRLGTDRDRLRWRRRARAVLIAGVAAVFLLGYGWQRTGVLELGALPEADEAAALGGAPPTE